MEKIKCRPVTFGGSTKPGSDYFKFREKIRESMKNRFLVNDREVSVKIQLYITERKADSSDLDNYLKAIVDGLCDFKCKWTGIKKGIIKFEKQIMLIQIKRIKVKSFEEEGVKIRVY